MHWKARLEPSVAREGGRSPSTVSNESTVSCLTLPSEEGFLDMSRLDMRYFKSLSPSPSLSLSLTHTQTTHSTKHNSNVHCRSIATNSFSYLLRLFLIWLKINTHWFGCFPTKVRTESPKQGLVMIQRKRPKTSVQGLWLTSVTDPSSLGNFSLV